MGLHPGQFAAQCLGCQFAPMAARFARAHQEASARARRRLLKKPSPPSLGGHSRLPARVMQPSGLRPSPTDAAAETGRWATSHRDVAAPEGEPSRCAAESLQKAKSRLPPWGRWTRVSEDGEGKLPASPSAPVAIALTGASAPVAGFFLADAH